MALFWQGLCWQVVLGADSHTSSHGGMGAFAVGLGGADILVATVLGESWIEVPEAIAVEYTGAVPFGLTGKEVILKTLGALGRNTVAMERSVEYVGEAVQRFSPDMRFTIANMTAEFGGLNGIFEPDAQVARWLAGRAGHNDRARYFKADPDAEYADRFRIDLDALEPQVAKPFSPDNVFGITEVLGMPLDGAFIGACTTTEEELVLAGMILERMLAAGHAPRTPTTRRLVVPGDLSIQARLKQAGLWDAYEKAGFRVGPPGCSMCLGVASEKAGEGEVWLSSQNRNFRDRMGKGSLAWLASGASVAASAMSMSVTDPRPWVAQIDQDRYHAILERPTPGGVPEVRVMEPTPLAEPVAVAAKGPATAARGATLSGVVQRFGDHVDTDAMIPGEFCHLTELSALGERCFNYAAPGFAERVRAGADVVVGGEGWGSGSSREQAVWALKGAGVQLVIARSYAFIHKRNLVNEAVPHLVLKDDAFYAAAVGGVRLSADLATGQVTVGGVTFQAEPPSAIAAAVASEGGIVPAIRAHGPVVFERLTA